MSGTTDKYKGQAKEAVGKATGNKDLEREGKTDQTGAKVKQATKDVKDKVDDVVDDIKEKLHKD